MIVCKENLGNKDSQGNKNIILGERIGEGKRH